MPDAASGRSSATAGKLLAVIRREYVEHVRTKSFAISTALVPLLMALLMFLPTMFARSASEKKQNVALVDRTGALMQALDAELTTDKEKDFLKGGARKYTLTAVPPEMASRLSYELVKQEGREDGEEKARLLDQNVPGEILEKLGANAIVDANPADGGGRPIEPQYYSRNVGDFEPIRRLRDALNKVVIAKRFESTPVPAEQVEALIARVDLEPVKIGQDGSVGGRDFAEEYFTAIFFVMMLYITTLMSGMALSRGLLEEKSNRVIEVLISSVTPFQLMTGKIVGHALVILTQLAVWGLVALAFALRGGAAAAEMFSVVTPTLVVCLVLYFILGYLLYAAMFAGVGSVCTTEMEAQQTQTPIVLMLIVPMVLAIAIVRQPDSTLALVLSMIPFTAPSIMMMRVALQTPPLVQIVASTLILIVSVAAAFWAVAKVFRVGILMTGKKMTFPEMWRWIRAA